jgi:TonB family protein
MPESATQPQSDTPSETQPVISEPLPSPEPPPPAWWRVNRGALLLIGVPLAGALLTWLGISIFSSKPTTPPAAVAEQPATPPAVETPPAIETPPAMEANAVSSAEAEPESVDPEPPQQPDAPPSAINEVTPDVPQSALNTISGTVRVSVRVTIDNAGAVVDAAADDPGPSRYFERLSVAASKKWTFTSANSEEQRTMLVKFKFTREGVTAEASPDEK